MNNIPLYAYIIILSVERYLVSSILWLLWISCCKYDNAGKYLLVSPFYPEVQLRDHMVVLFLILRMYHTYLQSGCTGLHSRPQCARVPVSPHHCQHLQFFGFLIVTILTGMRCQMLALHSFRHYVGHQAVKNLRRVTGGGRKKMNWRFILLSFVFYVPCNKLSQT